MSFFFNDPAPTAIYTLSLHDALPLSEQHFRSALAVAPNNARILNNYGAFLLEQQRYSEALTYLDRKSTRLNSSHVRISYAVFCLKKKKKKIRTHTSHRMCRMIRSTHT